MTAVAAAGIAAAASYPYPDGPVAGLGTDDAHAVRGASSFDGPATLGRRVPALRTVDHEDVAMPQLVQVVDDEPHSRVHRALGVLALDAVTVDLSRHAG